VLAVHHQQLSQAKMPKLIRWIIISELSHLSDSLCEPARRAILLIESLEAFFRFVVNTTLSSGM
jgi:hypothetical protein